MNETVEIDAATIPKRGKKWKAHIKQAPRTVDRGAAGYMIGAAIHVTELNQHMLDAKWRLFRGEYNPMESSLWAMKQLLPKLKHDLDMALHCCRYPVRD